MSYSCSKCNTVFKSKFNLDRHMNRKMSCITNDQSNALECMCKYCNKTFARMDNLEKHIEDKRCKILKIEDEKIKIEKEKTKLEKEKNRI
jgi:uncharacterized Zn-finger protein